MPPSRLRALACITLTAFAGLRAAESPPSAGLLFHVSADHGPTADFSAAGTPEPTFVSEVTTIPDGAAGPALRCGNLQRLAWSAPGNIYAQRGTLAFFWRSREPVGPTEFPIFRVAYADHSSWDMVWLRVDYNGHGFEAFVTDASLSRTRISYTMPQFPAASAWVHLAFAWDETRGIRFFVNGKLVAQKETVAVYDAGLDQFGPHSRIISPYQVQSDYNFTRGGDIDEIRIYDRMLDAPTVAALARNQPPVSPVAANAAESAARLAAFLHRYGFDRAAATPPELPAGKFVTIRKVEITEAFDLQRWWWKATDGIRETTWPGVYNRSRLPGRNDYFQLPDWDCYVDSGKAITFALPQETWNHLEISGAAWGKMELLKPGTALENAGAAPVESLLFDRPKSREKTTHALATRTGGQIRFTNAEQEQPIAELAAYHVTAAAEPVGSAKLVYRLTAAAPVAPSLAPLVKFIAGRFSPDGRTTLVAQPVTPSTSPTPSSPPSPSSHSALPLVHLLIPAPDSGSPDGLDGLALDLPALALTPNSSGLIALNLRIADPLWPARILLDVTFSVKPGEAKTLWLDTRDRFLPAGRALWISLASASADFSAASLVGAELRLVFKPRDAARTEHELDRFTQARDAYAMLVEEHPNSPKLALWVRFKGDLEDLLRVNPDHALGRLYSAAAMPGALPRPVFTQPAPPPGVPLWAFRQTELLGRVKKFVSWYIDHRQSAYGDFGGGISDDTDFTNLWPGVALMGSEPEKIKRSLQRLLDAAYQNGMFTRGLPTIQADELHSYEEGINCLAQNLVLDYGSPRQLERAMETARGVESITGINSAGHRHIRTSYYSGTRMAEEGPWGWSKPYSYLVTQVPQLLVDFNGNPAAKKYLVELADGLLAHRRPGAATPPTGNRGSGRRAAATGGASLPSAIHFATDAEGTSTRAMLPWHVFWGAWKFTGERRYLDPLLDAGMTALMTVNANTLDTLALRADWGPRLLGGERAGPTESRPQLEGRSPSPGAEFRNANSAHFVWQLTGDKTHLEQLYARQIESAAALEYINTEGSLWIDRVGIPNAELQRARLGGVALVRNALYPGHTVSWTFAAPANDQSVALLLPDATPTGFKVIAYNLSTTPVRATMTGWNIDPGTWEITQGLDSTDDDLADGPITTTTAVFERTRSLDFTLPPRATTILTLKLKTPGTPYWQRPDLGLDRADLTRTAAGLRVKIHSLGSVATPATTVVLRDRTGRIVATAAVPAIPAPLDLLPKTTEVTLSFSSSTDVTGATVELDPAHALTEITTRNNTVRL